MRYILRCMSISWNRWKLYRQQDERYFISVEKLLTESHCLKLIKTLYVSPQFSIMFLSRMSHYMCPYVNMCVCVNILSRCHFMCVHVSRCPGMCLYVCICTRLCITYYVISLWLWIPKCSQPVLSN